MIRFQNFVIDEKRVIFAEKKEMLNIGIREGEKENFYFGLLIVFDCDKFKTIEFLTESEADRILDALLIAKNAGSRNNEIR